MQNKFSILAVLLILSITCTKMSAQQSAKPSGIKFDWVAKKDTSIIGKAFNAKLGAVVVDPAENVFYIDGLDGWSEAMEGKILKVKGRLAQVIQPLDTLPPDLSKPIVQSSPGNMTYITNAKWGVIKKK